MGPTEHRATDSIAFSTANQKYVMSCLQFLTHTHTHTHTHRLHAINTWHVKEYKNQIPEETHENVVSVSRTPESLLWSSRNNSQNLDKPSTMHLSEITTNFSHIIGKT